VWSSAPRSGSGSVRHAADGDKGGSLPLDRGRPRLLRASAPPAIRRLLHAFVLAGASAPAQESLPSPREGDRLCSPCHPAAVEAILSGAHAPTVRSPALEGCATCHGPGDAHAKSGRSRDILGFARLSAARTTEACSLCHADEIRGYHRWEDSEFKAAGKRCTDCHVVHEAAGASLAARDRRRFPDPGALEAAAARTGPQACAECHPRQAERLGASDHALLAPGGTDAKGCEACHGAGSLHVEAKGVRRFITRPDATEALGIATCRQCHPDVDPVRFHWKEPPLLSPSSCAVCHRVHTPRAEGARAGLWAESLPAAEAYAGDAACRRCHAPAFAELEDANHRPRPVDAADPRHAGCEACHGPSGAHARSGGRAPPSGGRAPREAACLACHRQAEHFARWEGSTHARARVACLDCHPAAQPAFPGRGSRASDRCVSCHGDVVAQFRLPNHHPVPERGLRCTDCHDPHQESLAGSALSLRRDACVACHREKAGPFVFHHEADRVEGCVVCHEPHGSVNRRLLTHPTTHSLCLECHSDIPAFHDQSPGSFWRRCVDCHQEIHGSQFDRLFFR
jgi:DmsE family decaheme c-type cytochrome